MSQPVSDELANFTILRQPAPELGPRAQRTIARIIEATREVFLSYGYAGTTIDEIAKVAKVSRASFYTYFPSKRDVLLAAGARSSMQAQVLVEKIPGTVHTFDELSTWVSGYFAFLESEGAFAFAWTQAATNDEEIRAAGLQRHIHMARRLGEVLIDIGGTGRTDALELGLAMFGLLDRTWAFAHLYGDSIDRGAVERTVSLSVWAAAHQDPTQV